MTPSRRHFLFLGRLCCAALLAVVTMAVLALPPCMAGEQEVRVRSEKAPQAVSHDYFVRLLQLALDETRGEFGPARVEMVAFNPAQKRSLYELSVGNTIDVDWAGTSRETESLLRPIRVPLIGGLLGYRVPVVRRERAEALARVRTLDDLKAFTAVQGMHWPDADILEAAGLPLVRVGPVEQMYSLLRNGRVDYFPRGLSEVYAEMDAMPGDELVAYDSLLVAYPLPMYFFTAKANEALARRIEAGLAKARADGSFRRFMERHPATAHLFPLSKYAASRVIHLPNAGLPEATPLDDASLWLRPGGDSAP